MSETKQPKPQRDDAKTPDKTPIPPAGPHADPALTNPDATPGAGALPDPAAHADAKDVDGGVG